MYVRICTYLTLGTVLYCTVLTSTYLHTYIHTYATVAGGGMRGSFQVTFQDLPVVQWRRVPIQMVLGYDGTHSASPVSGHGLGLVHVASRAIWGKLPGVLLENVGTVGPRANPGRAELTFASASSPARYRASRSRPPTLVPVTRSRVILESFHLYSDVDCLSKPASTVN
ncbi:hypothetical protein F4859DRAFT_102965 [Xylaria cf. heliscus]|nr:hypothetical protein F4859DRAFT_102965 [Xylaria cf. heliscus]